MKVTGPGHDHIDVKFVKMCVEPLSHALEKLINQSFELGIFPDSLKLAKISPIHKGDSPEDVTNYRPIAILPILSKVIEKLVYNRLNEHLEHNSIINNSQFGFRKNSSPLHAIVSTTEYIIKNLDEGKHVVGVFLDLRKAFDVIDHKILLSKLRHYGITEAALRWCTTYLRVARSVKLRGAKS